ncbi:MAG: sensor domain-containing diguanylate cyclase, partial [Mariprofundaceae bacterium]|nr:sensor domain-containing diguanylate cyclase [Mariprofundaceae bacterium]
MHANEEMDGSTHLLVEAVLKMYDSLSVRTLELMREMLQRQRTEQRLQLSKNVIDSTLESIFISDAEGLIIDANPSFCADVGSAFAELAGKDIRKIKPALFNLEDDLDIWSEARINGHWSGEIVGLNQDGVTETIWLTLSAVKGDEGGISHFAGVMSSISHLLERQHSLELEVNHDVLTGLPNRRLLGDRLKQALVHNTRNHTVLAVCFIDLDGFKAVNDTLGHAAGDALLCTVSERLKTLLRAEDTVARVGG